MKLKFTVMINTEEDIKNTKFKKSINKFEYNGSKYLNISPNPFVVIDISKTSDKGDGYNSNTQVYLNRNNLYDLIYQLGNFIKSYNDKALYFYRDKRLYVQNDLAKKYAITIHAASNKVIHMRSCVVVDDQNQEVEYEGCSFMINSPDNFCLITYSELLYLYRELNMLNMNQMLLSLVQLFHSMTKDELEQEEPTVLKRTFEEVRVEKDEVQTTARLKEPSEIPKDL